MNAPVRAPRPAAPGAMRVTGTLTEDARVYPGTGQHAVLHLHFQPERGLPYVATVDLGTDLADHLATEQLLPHMRAGHVVSVAAEGTELRTDHHHAVLRLVQPHAVVLLEDPITAEA